MRDSYEGLVYPCESCDKYDNCDPWEAGYCCALCHYHNENPDCENCDPWDI